MSSGPRMSLDRARAFATSMQRLLQPGCRRLVIVGSVRRCKRDVGDIELLAEPLHRDAGQVGLFGGGGRINALWALVDELVTDPLSGLQRAAPVPMKCPSCRGAARHSADQVCRGCNGTGLISRAAPWGDLYRQVQVENGPKIDLFTADERNWGAMMVVRTGPPELSQAWVTALRGAGLLMRGGYVRHVDTDTIVDVPDETDAFDLVGWPWQPADCRVESDYTGRWPE